uniref:Uncharacterized protein n=1 Tax=Strongyloides stercoralis TaxID=6248 RepID=A0AAF5DJ10_STRER
NSDTELTTSSLKYHYYKRKDNSSQLIIKKIIKILYIEIKKCKKNISDNVKELPLYSSKIKKITRNFIKKNTFFEKKNMLTLIKERMTVVTLIPIPVLRSHKETSLESKRGNEEQVGKGGRRKGSGGGREEKERGKEEREKGSTKKEKEKGNAKKKREKKARKRRGKGKKHVNEERKNPKGLLDSDFYLKLMILNRQYIFFGIPY